MNEDRGAGLVGKCRRLEKRGKGKGSRGGGERLEPNGGEASLDTGDPSLLCAARKFTSLSKAWGKWSNPFIPLEFGLYSIIYRNPPNPLRDYPNVCFQPSQSRIPSAAPIPPRDCARVPSQASSPQVPPNSTILWSGGRSRTASPVPLRGFGSSPFGVAV